VKEKSKIEQTVIHDYLSGNKSKSGEENQKKTEGLKNILIRFAKYKTRRIVSEVKNSFTTAFSV
jgi:hypothetical protein